MELRRQDVADMLATLHSDLESRLERIDDYVHGRQDPPYMPANATAEYKLLARRCISNWLPLVVNSPAQALRVDGYRRGTDVVDRKIDANDITPEWDHWKASRLDARQHAVHRGALIYGHSFTVTELVNGKPITKGLSPLRTVCFFEDPANDDVPQLMITVTRFPKGDRLGEGWAWDESHKYPFRFKSLTDEESVAVGDGESHGSLECPGTRFATQVDLDGRTRGVVEPMMPLQDRINQTVFDLLIAQTYSSFEVRTAAGMAPPMVMEPIYETEGDPTSPVIGRRPVLNPDTGEPIFKEVNFNASRLLVAADKDTKFGSLPGGNLSGFIESIDMSIRHFAAISQTPPHHLLGQVANLSAEALQAAEKSLHRLVVELTSIFGESWERVFRLAAHLAGDTAVSLDVHGEVVWFDSESRSMSQVLDALIKATDLGIPGRGLWERMPGVTQAEIRMWEELAEQADPQLQLAQALERSSSMGGFGGTVGTGTGEPGVPSSAS